MHSTKRAKPVGFRNITDSVGTTITILYISSVTHEVKLDYIKHIAKNFGQSASVHSKTIQLASFYCTVWSTALRAVSSLLFEANEDGRECMAMVKIERWYTGWWRFCFQPTNSVALIIQLSLVPVESFEWSCSFCNRVDESLVEDEITVGNGDFVAAERPLKIPDAFSSVQFG